MKIAITATHNKIDQPFNPRFGRADFFILIDSETKEWEALPNPAASAGGGAGPQAVQFIAQKGAEVLISGRYGPKAFTALQAAGIQPYIAETGTISEVLEHYMAGQLTLAGSASGPGFHG